MSFGWPAELFIATPEAAPPSSGNAVLDAVIALGKVLCTVILAQVVGYVMAWKKLLSPQAISGVGAFGGLVSFPALLFRAVATLDFHSVQLEIVVALVGGKILLLLLCYALGRITSEKTAGDEWLRGGAFALLMTNSDDLGLGLPVLNSIFPPKIVSMAFVFAVLQGCVINPMIFMMLGIGAAKRDAPTDGSPAASTTQVVLAVLRGLTKNLGILAACLGLLYNALFSGLTFSGAKLPFFLENTCVMLSSAFGPIVQFLGGASAVGAFSDLARLNSALMPMLTAIAKTLLLPTAVTAVVGSLGASKQAVDFAYVFSSLPVAASTVVFAAAYKPPAAINTLLGASLFLGKVVGFPLLFLSTAVLKTEDAHDILNVESSVAAALQRVSLPLGLLLLLAATWHPAWRRPPLLILHILIFYHSGYVVCGLVAGQVLEQYMQPASAELPLTILASAFGSVSFFRWAADAVIVYAAHSRYMEVRARLKAMQRATTTTQQMRAKEGHGHEIMERGMTICRMSDALLGAHDGGQHDHDDATVTRDTAGGAPVTRRATRRILGSGGDAKAALVRHLFGVAAGAAMTLPWVLHFNSGSSQWDKDGDGTVDAKGALHLPLWMPDGGLQALVYAVVYAAMTVHLVMSVGGVMMANTRTSELIMRQNLRNAERCVYLSRLETAHSFYVRFECFLFLSITRFALAAVVCGQLAFDASLTGSMGAMLLMQAILHNSTILLLFMLFGMGEKSFDLPMRTLAECFFRNVFAAASPKKHVAVVEELDTIASVAMGTGFEDTRPTTGQRQRANAESTIQKYAKRRASVKAFQRASVKFAP